MVVSPYRVACLLCCGLVSFGAAARAQEPPPPTPAEELDSPAAFDRARIYYESARYAACAEAFARLLERRIDTLGEKERAGARTYLGACLIALGKREEARQQFRQAILEDRQLEAPDPVVFPQAVIDVFVEVRSSLMDALRQQQDEEIERRRREARNEQARQARERRRVAELERVAGLETVVRKNERWMAWVPFGLGQFHNDNPTLGWIFLTTEGALAITAITATSIELGLHAQADGGRAPLDNNDLTDKVRLAHQVGTISWLALAGVAAAGIVEAHLSFRSEVWLGQRKRPLPDSLRPEPAPEHSQSVSPVIGAGYVGVAGSF
jgi:tetratricopeptide (TPR) repeat protein